MKSVSCAMALIIGASMSPLFARQQRDARGNAIARFDAQTQRSPLGPGEEELEGTLEVLVEDHARGSVVHHFLNTDRGKVRLLQALGETDLNGKVTGERVRARGRRSLDGSSLELKPGAASGGESSVTTTALATSNTFGQQRVIVIMINFSDNLGYSTNVSEATSVTFGSVSSFFQENSYGQTYLTGDVVGTFTIPMSSGVCDSNQIAAQADQAAASAGVNLNNYSRRVYAFPSNSCGWWGLGTVGGNPSRAWINGSYQTKVVAHELGHNFGDWHSNAQPCENGACSNQEYGDDRDMMGGYGTGHFHAYQKERLGWLNYGSSPSIQTVTSSGSYFISALQASSSGPKALKLLQGSGIYYYVEARAQIGFDAGYAPGVLIHTGSETNGNSAYQVDMDPLSSTMDTMLDPGQTFTDTVRNISFRTISVDSTGAWVEITMAAQPCTMRAPQLTLSPSGTVSATAGVAKSFTLTVKNTDDSTCGQAVFAPSVSGPGDWGWTASASSISLNAGATTSVGLTVTPSASATGSTSVTFSTARTNVAGPGNSASVTMSIPTPTPTPTPTPAPPAPPADVAVSLTASMNSPQFTLVATVKNNGAAAAGLTVKFSVTDPRGVVDTYTATTNSVGVATVKGRMKPKDPRGAYVASATATLGGSTSTGSAGFIY